MNMNQSFKSVFVNWKNFSGRASRSEFWWFTLCSAFIKYFYDVSTTLLEVCGLEFAYTHTTITLQWTGIIWSVVVLIPTIAVSLRRLHDIGKSGWYYLLCIPMRISLAWITLSPSEISKITLFFFFFSLILNLFLIFLYIKRGQEGTNKYGDNPVESSSYDRTPMEAKQIFSIIVSLVILIYTLGIYKIQPEHEHTSERIQRLLEQKLAESERDEIQNSIEFPYKDTETGLTWSTKSRSAMNWETAKKYCDDLTEGDSSDWRLPNIDELKTTIKNCSKTETGGECKVSEKNGCLSGSCWEPKGSCFCDFKESSYYSKLGDDDDVTLWSSSVLSDNSSGAWLVGSDGGLVGLDYKSSDVYVRCVK